MDGESEADFGKGKGKGRRRERFAQVQHDDDEIAGEGRQSLRTKHSNKNVGSIHNIHLSRFLFSAVQLQESSDEEAHQANKRLNQRDPDFDPKGKATRDQDNVEALKLKQPLDNVQQLENAAETLKCTELHMEKWHKDMRLPNKVDYAFVEIANAAADGESNTKLQAS